MEALTITGIKTSVFDGGYCSEVSHLYLSIECAGSIELAHHVMPGSACSNSHNALLSACGF